MHFTTFVNILPKLRYFEGRNYTNWLQELFSTFVFLIDLWKVGTSWISRKGEILEKGGWSRKGGSMTPPTNYGWQVSYGCASVLIFSLLVPSLKIHFKKIIIKLKKFSLKKYISKYFSKKLLPQKIYCKKSLHKKLHFKKLYKKNCSLQTKLAKPEI